MENKPVRIRFWSDVKPGDLLIYASNNIGIGGSYLVLSRKISELELENDPIINDRFKFALLTQEGRVINYTGINEHAFVVVKLKHGK